MGKTTVHYHSTGYRLDGLRDDGRVGFYGAPDADPVRCPRIANRPRPHELHRWTPAAFCLYGHHIAPHPDPRAACACGWRVCELVADLAGQELGHGLDVSLRHLDDVSLRPVVAEVSAWGPTLHSEAFDPAATVRTTWLRLESRIWIQRDVPLDLVKKVRRTYPWASVGEFRTLLELSDRIDEHPSRSELVDGRGTD